MLQARCEHVEEECARARTGCEENIVVRLTMNCDYESRVLCVSLGGELEDVQVVDESKKWKSS